MSPFVRTGRVRAALPGPRLYYSVFGPERGWCRHEHGGLTSATWCQRERRGGEPDGPADPYCLVVEVLGSGLLRPVTRKGVVLAADGSAFRVRAASAVPYPPLTFQTWPDKAAFAGWMRGPEVCGHRHARPDEAGECIERQSRRLEPHRLTLDGSGVALIQYNGDTRLWHPTLLRPARDPFGVLFDAADYPFIRGPGFTEKGE